jgi:hypothetical protein
MLTSYTHAELPPAPAVFDMTAKVGSWPMYGNEKLGDCTAAAAGHMVQAWTANANTLVTPTDGDVLGLYWATGAPPNEPCQPGGPTDTGRVELDVLNQWRNVGFGGDRIVGYAKVSLRDTNLVKQATAVFGGLYIGAALPLSAQGQHEWDVAVKDAEPGSWGGHAIPIVGYDPDTFTVVTWGGTLKMTTAFLHTYVDEAYALLSRDWLDAQGATPAGFDLAALQADLAAL